MKEVTSEIVLHNGFPNQGDDGILLVGILSKGEVLENAVLKVGDREIKMNKIKIREDAEHKVFRIEFEVDRNIEPPVNWWKLYQNRVEVKNTTSSKS